MGDNLARKLGKVNDTDEKLGENIIRKLVAGGLHTPRQIKHASDDDILAVRGIGPGQLKKIRKVFPKV